MKRGQIIEGTCTRVDFPNKGIMETEGRTFTVKNALPGQKIRASVSKLKSGKGEARILEVLEQAPGEIESDCPHFAACGGCTYRTMAYADQLQMKREQIRRLLGQVLSEEELEKVFEGIKESPDKTCYRNKMEFTFGDECLDGPMSLGMHARGSFYDIVTTDHCQIVHEDFCKILSCVLELAKGSGAVHYHRLRHTGYFRHLLVRRAAATGEILVDLVTTTQAESAEWEKALEEKLVQSLTDLKLTGHIAGILHTWNDSLADVVANDRTECLYGQSYFYEELLGLRFKITPFSFFQTNSHAAEVLYETAREYVGDTNGKVLFDLYSGTGTIAQILAPVAAHVTGVEIVEEAVEAAKENAAMNGLSNCDFIAGDVLKVVDDLTDKPDIIVLDPPRDGIHPKAIGKIIRFGVDCIVYISCKPTSLVRDLEVFKANGYQVERVVCCDLFPGTFHTETVVLLSQQKADDYIEIDLDLDEMDITSAETKATYREVQQYVLQTTGLMVSNLNIAQIKDKCGFDKRENYNKPRTANSRQPKCTPEKEKAIMDAFRHFGMI